jgi:hypothetical protein
LTTLTFKQLVASESLTNLKWDLATYNGFVSFRMATIEY